MRDATLPDTSTARVIGVDDWAWRKGSHYGTVIIDQKAVKNKDRRKHRRIAGDDYSVTGLCRRCTNRGIPVRAISRQLTGSRQTARCILTPGNFRKLPAPNGYRRLYHLSGIRAQGYRGSYRPVRHWKAQVNAEKWPVSPLSGTQKQPKVQAWSACHAVRLLFKERDTLTEEQQQTLEQMLNANSEVRQAYNFGQSFVRMIRYGFSKAPEPWLEAAGEHGAKKLRAFAKSLQRDKAAVFAALSLPWSNGQVEGQVNRLKIIKRQMYGRAKFDLLRLRVLAPS